MLSAKLPSSSYITLGIYTNISHVKPLKLWFIHSPSVYRLLQCFDIIDSVLGKRVLMYWEKLGIYQSLPPKCPNSTHIKLYISGRKRFSSFQKCIVSHGYYGNVFLAVITTSPLSSIFPSTLGPFSLMVFLL